MSHRFLYYSSSLILLLFGQKMIKWKKRGLNLLLTFI